MQTIAQQVTTEITEKKSKFIGDIFYVETAEEAEEKIEEIKKKYHDAKHHCFAYRILEANNILERASDDGEPTGTAGAPMLQMLSKNELVNILVVVTRYFGGILLGTGGLVRAYSQATSNSLEKAKIVEIAQGERLKIPFSYQNLAYLQYYCKKNEINIIETNFEVEPYAIIDIVSSKKDKMLRELQEKQFSMENIQIIERKNLRKDK